MEVHIDNLDNTKSKVFVFEDEKSVQHKVKYNKVLSKSIPLNEKIELTFSKND
jgi:hypothetical protein